MDGLTILSCKRTYNTSCNKRKSLVVLIYEQFVNFIKLIKKKKQDNKYRELHDTVYSCAIKKQKNSPPFFLI